MKLTPGERAALTQRLLASLDEDAEIEDAWAAEVLGKAVADIPYIGLAERAGLGTASLQAASKQEIEL